jgi:IS5 family transposase
MKAHIGVDAESGLVHSVVGTAANVSDVTQAGALLHGERRPPSAMRVTEACISAMRRKGPSWHVAMQPGKRRRLDPTSKWARLLEQVEQLKASVRAKVEHPFHVIKNLFRHKKVRYKGLAKNEAQLFSLFGPCQSRDRQKAVVGAPGPRCVLTVKATSQTGKTLQTASSRLSQMTSPLRPRLLRFKARR